MATFYPEKPLRLPQLAPIFKFNAEIYNSLYKTGSGNDDTDGCITFEEAFAADTAPSDPVRARQNLKLEISLRAVILGHVPDQMLIDAGLVHAGDPRSKFLTAVKQELSEVTSFTRMRGCLGYIVDELVSKHNFDVRVKILILTGCKLRWADGSRDQEDNNQRYTLGEKFLDTAGEAIEDYRTYLDQLLDDLASEEDVFTMAFGERPAFQGLTRSAEYDRLRLRQIHQAQDDLHKLEAFLEAAKDVQDLNELPPEPELWHYMTTSQQIDMLLPIFDQYVHQWLHPLHGILDVTRNLNEPGSQDTKGEKYLYLRHLFVMTCIVGHKEVLAPRAEAAAAHLYGNPRIIQALSRQHMGAGGSTAATDQYLKLRESWNDISGLPAIDRIDGLKSWWVHREVKEGSVRKARG